MHTDRRTNRLTDKQTDGQTDRQTNIQTYTDNIQKDRGTDRQKDNEYKHRQTDEQIKTNNLTFNNLQNFASYHSIEIITSSLKLTLCPHYTPTSHKTIAFN